MLLHRAVPRSRGLKEYAWAALGKKATRLSGYWQGSPTCRDSTRFARWGLPKRAWFRYRGLFRPFERQQGHLGRFVVALRGGTSGMVSRATNNRFLCARGVFRGGAPGRVLCCGRSVGVSTPAANAGTNFGIHRPNVIETRPIRESRWFGVRRPAPRTSVGGATGIRG